MRLGRNTGQAEAMSKKSLVRLQARRNLMWTFLLTAGLKVKSNPDALSPTQNVAKYQGARSQADPSNA